MQNRCHNSSAPLTTAAVTRINPAGGNVTRKPPTAARVITSKRGGEYVLPSTKPALGSRFGRSRGGEPSHVAPGCMPSLLGGGARERTPTSDPSPICAPAGTTALLPTKARRPRRVGASVIQPFSTRPAPSDASSATVPPSPISRRSGTIEVAVESCTSLLSFAPSVRYQGAR